MSPKAALQEGVEHPLQAACGGVVFSTLDWHSHLASIRCPLDIAVLPWRARSDKAGIDLQVGQMRPDGLGDQPVEGADHVA